MNMVLTASAQALSQTQVLSPLRHRIIIMDTIIRLAQVLAQDPPLPQPQQIILARQWHLA